MNDAVVSFFSTFNSQLITGLVAFLLSLPWLTFRWLNTAPKEHAELYLEAGVKPYQHKLSMMQLGFWQIRPLDPVSRRCQWALILVLSAALGFFIWSSIIMAQHYPSGWASRVMKESKETFLISHDSAKNFPGEKEWVLTPALCHQDLYSTLAEQRSLSETLVATVCGQIGLTGEQESIAQQIAQSQQNKWAGYLMCGVASFFIGGLLLSILMEIRVRHRVVLLTDRKANLMEKTLM